MVWDRPEIDAIKARVEAAKPGPWKWTEDQSPGEARRTWCGPQVDVIADELCSQDGRWVATCGLLGGYRWYDPAVSEQGLNVADFPAIGMDQADADFIAHARQDVPALLEYIAFLERFIDEQTGL
jgi:hypothetical protein